MLGLSEGENKKGLRRDGEVKESAVMPKGSKSDYLKSNKT